MAVISFTADDGRPDQLESDAIVRVRRILDSERQQHNANTKIVWSRDSYAKETPAAFIGLLTSVEGVSKWLGAHHAGRLSCMVQRQIVGGPHPGDPVQYAAGGQVGTVDCG